ncbi:hypothetical protein [Phyllobacterium myrsinacearum]|uniref:Uncharacterized protein n=1 Tax=Phyllobacterium myrsinacearum TaxID=28101 RepID=A0A839EIV3_9HYPH|nr:hypothetical protein [Phyllobacterium myrsinacearum]MBA8878812.1 hypothetical protein [Phyllobacterium myrsinacearum]
MRVIPAVLSMAILPAMLAQQAFSAEKRFADATETNDQLMKLYDKAGDVCLRNPSRDVHVTVACMSMTVYGVALNERGWCYGKKQEANAFKKWHECEENSDRFSKSSLAGF